MKSANSVPERESRSSVLLLTHLITIIVLAALAWCVAVRLTGNAEFNTRSTYLPIDGGGSGQMAAFVLSFAVMFTAYVALVRLTSSVATEKTNSPTK